MLLPPSGPPGKQEHPWHVDKAQGRYVQWNCNYTVLTEIQKSAGQPRERGGTGVIGEGGASIGI
jgi:hypothetical protein